MKTYERFLIVLFFCLAGIVGCAEMNTNNPDDKITRIGQTPDGGIYRLEYEGQVYLISNKGFIIKHEAK